MTDLEIARSHLASGNYTCVVCKEDTLYFATDRGVKPLLNWLDSGLDFSGFSAADKVVGRATAFLYCLLGIREVYAGIMSSPAAQVLEEHGINAHWSNLVEGIINRRGTGPCPFEATVMDIHDPNEALAAIRRKMQQI